MRYIINSILESLNKNPNHKFTYVEQSFWQRWWSEAKDEQKELARKLVKNGQLELNLGGWVMHDEACTNYEGMIHQMALGTKYIKDQFGIRPRVGWHIDPFGHSSQNARLMSEMGFDAFGTNRIDYLDKERRRQSQTLETIWRGSTSLDEDSDIFMFNFWDHYYTPPQIKFNTWYKPRNISIDDYWSVLHPKLRGYGWDIPKIADEFVPICKEKAALYIYYYIILLLLFISSSSFHFIPFFFLLINIYSYNNGGNVLIPFGADFSFTNADNCFDPMDELIEYVNSHYDKYHIKFRYSTFGDYINIVHNNNTDSKKWPVFKGDFFPYADKTNAYWGGYYTSRPYKKGLIRDAYGLLRSSELLFADSIVNGKVKAGNSTQNIYDNIMKLRQNQAVTLHHDAITGTEKQFVNDDYVTMLDEGMKKGNDAICELLSYNLDKKDIGSDSTKVLNTLKKEEEVGLIIYNSNSWEAKEIISIMVNRNDLIIKDSDNKEVEIQYNIIPQYSVDANEDHKFYLYFPVKVNAVGYSIYHVTVGNNNNIKNIGKIYNFNNNSNNNNASIENSKYELILDPTTGHISQLKLKELSSKTIRFEEELYQYEGVSSGQCSGAYSFRPTSYNGDYQSTSSEIHEHEVPFHEGKPEIMTILSTVNGVKEDDRYVITGNKKLSNGKIVYQYKYLTSRSIILHNGLLPLNKDNLNRDNEFGVYHIGSKSGKDIQVTIPINRSFPNKNEIKIQTELYNTDSNEYFTSSILDINEKNFTVYIYYYNSENTQAVDWKSDLELHYVIYTDEKKSFSTYYSHMEVLSKKSDNIIMEKGVTTKTFKIPLNEEFREDYFLIGQVKSDMKSAFILNIVDRSQNDFTVRLHSLIDIESDLNIELFYLAIPTDAKLESVNGNVKTNVRIVKGNLVEEIEMNYRKGYSETIRLYNTEYNNNNVIEYIYDLGPTDDGKEIISRIRTDIKSKNTFYSDLNGLESRERHNEYKYISENIAGNYYPSVMRLYIEDSDLRLTVLHDRSHGVASLSDGELEFMLHRRTLMDDGYGVMEPLKENNVFKVRSWILVDNVERSIKQHRQLSRFLSHPLNTYSYIENNNRRNSINSHHSLLSKELPKNIELLSFHAMDNNENITIRLHHIYEKNEDNELSQEVKIELGEYFNGLKIEKLTEMILTGYERKDVVEKERLTWNSENGIRRVKPIRNSDKRANEAIILKPMEIKTFVASIKP